MSQSRKLMQGQCAVCDRPSLDDSNFCTLHDEASRNLEDAYGSWSKAHDAKFSREDFFKALVGLNETGAAVRQLITYLQEKTEVR